MTDETIMLNVRFPPELLERLDRYLEEMRRERKDLLSVNRSVAVRALVVEALDKREAERKGRRS